MGKFFYIYSRKLHRIFLFAVTILTLIMGVTGLSMKYPGFGSALRLDAGLVRYVHNQLSVLFAIALGCMMLTGLYMYCYPLYQQRRARRAAASASTPQTPTDP